MSHQHVARIATIVLCALAFDLPRDGLGSVAALAAPSDAAPGHPGVEPAGTAADVTPMVVVEPQMQDAGIVRRGAVAKYEFTIWNRKTVPLEISVQPSCGCTVASYDKTIGPGQSGKIAAELRTSGLSGKVSKSLEILTDDSDRPRFELKLTATVRELIRPELPAGNTFYLTPGETAERFLVHVFPREALSITDASSTEPFVDAQVREIAPSTPEVSSFEIQLEVRADAPWGRSEFIVTLATDSPTDPVHRVRLACEKGIVAPRNISFAASRATAEGRTVETCMLKSTLGPIQIVSLETTDPRIGVTARPLRGGEVQLLTLTFDAAKPSADSPRLLRIGTNDPHQSLLEIPIVLTAAEERSLASSSHAAIPLGSAGRRMSSPIRSARSETGQRSSTRESTDPARPNILQVEPIPGRTLHARHGESLRQSFFVRLPPSETGKLKSVQCDVPFVTAELRSEGTDMSSYEVTLLVSADAPVGRTPVVVTLEVDSPQYIRQQVQLYCEKGIVGCSALDLGVAAVGDDSPLERNCLLKNWERPIEIRALRSSDPHVQATARSLLDGTHQVLKLTYDGSGPPGLQQGILSVETDDPHQPTLEIPFHYRRGEP